VEIGNIFVMGSPALERTQLLRADRLVVALSADALNRAKRSRGFRPERVRYCVDLPAGAPPMLG
jgi:hypothetical protein